MQDRQELLGQRQGVPIVALKIFPGVLSRRLKRCAVKPCSHYSLRVLSAKSADRRHLVGGLSCGLYFLLGGMEYTRR